MTISNTARTSSSDYGRIDRERAHTRVHPYADHRTDRRRTTHEREDREARTSRAYERATSSTSASSQRSDTRPIGAGSSQRLNPPQITALLKKAPLSASSRDIRSLSDVCTQHIDEFNEIHLSTAIHALAEKVKKLNEQERNATIQEYRTLINTLADKILARIDRFESRSLSNIAWAFATLNIKDEALFTAISTAATAKISSFNAQALANTAWAFATLNIRNEALFDAISNAATAKISSFTEQGLANTAWAFATLNIKDEALFTAISTAATAKISSFNAQELANTAWAFATLNIRNEALFAAISTAATAKISSFNAQDLANTAWAFATLNIRKENLFTAISTAATRTISSFNAQNLANTAWAFATLNIKKEALFTAISNAATAKISSFNEQDLDNTAWAFAITQPDDKLVSELFFHLNQVAEELSDLECCAVFQSLLGVRALRTKPLSGLKDLTKLKAKINQALQTLRQQPPSSSRLHQNVMHTLDGIKVPYRSEVFESGYFLDIVLDPIAEKMVIEVDGPSHNLEHNGSDWLREQILKGHGWTVHHISYKEWNRLKEDEKPIFLEKLAAQLKMDAEQRKKDSLAQLQESAPQKPVRNTKVGTLIS